ncbi:hypothetical protein DPMN_065740 [Dreissena polymorpha]|uniref:Uncharacterized protein n=1 Tax=Dreissena polymorpha TaxID=45954 RepID=A0A9D4BSA5_DREPO|nr:hypothetical protein DPMN_065740 [Dreissena polymorpha]
MSLKSKQGKLRCLGRSNILGGRWPVRLELSLVQGDNGIGSSTISGLVELYVTGGEISVSGPSLGIKVAV